MAASIIPIKTHGRIVEVDVFADGNPSATRVRPPLFYDAALTQPVLELPVIVGQDTTFYTSAAGSYLVSVRFAGKEMNPDSNRTGGWGSDQPALVTLSSSTAAVDVTTPIDQGNWQAGRAYKVGDQVEVNGNGYVCVQAHTSGSAFSGNPAVWQPQGAPGAQPGASGTPWLQAAASGSRPATDILMSAYDTNPAATDHTTAFLSAIAAAQALIAAGAFCVRIILDSRQSYSIGGAVTAGANGQWAQIPWPYVTSSRGVIKFVGMPRGNDFSIYGNRSATVIESTLASAPAYSASVGIASIFGGPASYCTGHVGATLAPSRIGIGFQDVTIRSASPVICGVDAGFINALEVDGVLQFDTDAEASTGTLVACTAPQAIPLICPLVGNNVGAIGDTLCVAGWLCGPVLGDFVHFKRLIGFYLSGATLNLDVSDQVARIDYLQEWGCAYGIAATAPPSATPVSPNVTGLASKTSIANLIATAVHIGSWNVQTSTVASGNPLRVYDLMDANSTVLVDAEFDSTDYNFNKNQPIILGFGPSLTGQATYARIRNSRSRTAAFNLTLSASGVVSRNPIARDGLVTLSGGTVTAVSVNATAIQNLSTFMLPANAIFSITYSSAPTAQFQPL